MHFASSVVPCSIFFLVQPTAFVTAYVHDQKEGDINNNSLPKQKVL